MSKRTADEAELNDDDVGRLLSGETLTARSQDGAGGDDEKQQQPSAPPSPDKVVQRAVDFVLPEQATPRPAPAALASAPPEAAPAPKAKPTPVPPLSIFGAVAKSSPALPRVDVAKKPKTNEWESLVEPQFRVQHPSEADRERLARLEQRMERLIAMCEARASVVTEEVRVDSSGDSESDHEEEEEEAAEVDDRGDDGSGSDLSDDDSDLSDDDDGGDESDVSDDGRPDIHEEYEDIYEQFMDLTVSADGYISFTRLHETAREAALGVQTFDRMVVRALNGMSSDLRDEYIARMRLERQQFLADINRMVEDIPARVRQVRARIDASPGRASEVARELETEARAARKAAEREAALQRQTQDRVDAADRLRAAIAKTAATAVAALGSVAFAYAWMLAGGAGDEAA